MGIIDFFRQQPPVVVAYAAFAPLLAAAGLATARDSVPHATVALVLVVIVVAAAATGLRWAGWTAALSSALWFDWFHTVPYESFTIDGGEDVQVAVLLFMVGAGVTELAISGQRWHARAAQEAARLESLSRAARLAAERPEPDALARFIEAQVVALLDLDRAAWVPGPPEAHAVTIGRDGVVARGGVEIDVARHGLPTEVAACLPVGDARPRGRFDLVAATRVVRPTREALRAAALLADQMTGEETVSDRPVGHPARTDSLRARGAVGQRARRPQAGG
ncbi:uncharacterized protein DUF4118 [Knoellia remsis]|uniref:Uncharacterized protein DUF4118 n=1 Tax=Knoellia remsis TaxID=407159 RepID=A0A2T0U9W2_9MICO|nr:DUF4118 domain-containing protein [Knoellia remsis]PRY54699.1 uncharacterized protein DUF4118 [Knoellia remsis]